MSESDKSLKSLEPISSSQIKSESDSTKLIANFSKIISDNSDHKTSKQPTQLLDQNNNPIISTTTAITSSLGKNAVSAKTFVPNMTLNKDPTPAEAAAEKNKNGVKNSNSLNKDNKTEDITKISNKKTTQKVEEKNKEEIQHKQELEINQHLKIIKKKLLNK